jgi:hypothetical protein
MRIIAPHHAHHALSIAPHRATATLTGVHTLIREAATGPDQRSEPRPGIADTVTMWLERGHVARRQAERETAAR